MKFPLLALAAVALAGCSPSGNGQTPAAASPPPTAAAPTSGPAAADAAGAEAFLREALAIYATPAAYAAHEARQAAEGERRAALSDAEIPAETAREDAAAAAEDARLYTPQLFALLQRARATEGGLNAVPLCMCQDDAGMIVRTVTTAPQADGRVRADVSFGQGPGVLRYTLEQTSAGWRIANVVDSGRPGNDGDIDLVQMLSAPAA